MKKIFSLILFALLPLVANADPVEIDGIYYNLVSKIKDAEVTSNPNGYSGAVNIPSSVTYEGKEFNVTSIGYQAFYSCSGLTSVTIPNSVTSIGIQAFDGCSSLTSVTIPNSVTSIGNQAFDGCSGLTSINIPNSVTSIGIRSFEGCSSLTSVTIGSGVTSINSYAFYRCYGLKKVIVPDIAAWCGISFFDHEANPLYYAHHLYSDEETEITDLIIPNSVTSIGIRSFDGYTSLTSITIPNSVTSIGEGAFYQCSGLKKVIVPDIAAWCGITYGGGYANPLSVAHHLYSDEITEITDLVIPNCVTSIGWSAFSGCNDLTSITIPNSVTSIGGYAFSSCSGLTSVTIPNSITSILNGTFYGCGGLTSVTIGNGATSIGYSAFANCPELADVYCYAENVPNTENNVFEGSYIEYATLHVPETALEKYKDRAPWSNFGKIVATDGDTPEPPKPEKCVTPTISYANGKLTFSSETEGAICQSTITDSDITSYSGNEVQLSATYTITVYATRDGYENSEVATGTLCWIDVAPQTEGIVNEDAVMEVKAMPVLIQSQGGAISIQGAVEGTPIAVYDIEGKQYGSTIAEKDRATITTSLRPGSIAVVKIGEKSIKVLIK